MKADVLRQRPFPVSSFFSVVDICGPEERLVALWKPDMPMVVVIDPHGASGTYDKPPVGSDSPSDNAG